jgi:hypothetical protein
MRPMGSPRTTRRGGEQGDGEDERGGLHGSAPNVIDVMFRPVIHAHQRLQVGQW